MDTAIACLRQPLRVLFSRLRIYCDCVYACFIARLGCWHASFHVKGEPLYVELRPTDVVRGRCQLWAHDPGRRRSKILIGHQ